MAEHESQQRTPNTGIIIAWHPAATRPWCCQRLRAALVAGVGGRRTNQTLPQSKKEAVVGGPAVAGSTRREHASSNRRLKGWFDLLPYLALPGAVVRLTFNQLSVMHCCPCGWKAEVQSPFHHRLCRPRRFLALAQHASMAATAHRWRWCCGAQQTVRQPRCRRRLRVLRRRRQRSEALGPR